MAKSAASTLLGVTIPRATARRPFLKERDVPFTALAGPETLPEAARCCSSARTRSTRGESTSSRLAAYASAGRTVIVLEQKNPLKYQGLPAEMEPEMRQTIRQT